MAKYARGGRLTHTSLYDPSEASFYIDSMNKEADKAMMTNAAVSKQMSELYNTPTANPELLQQKIDDFTGRIGGVREKYGDDMALATNDIISEIGRAKKDPFWNYNTQQVEAVKDFDKQKSRLGANALELRDPRNVSMDDFMAGESLTGEVHDINDYRRAIDAKLSQYEKLSRDEQLTKDGVPGGYYKQRSYEGLYNREVDPLIQQLSAQNPNDPRIQSYINERVTSLKGGWKDRYLTDREFDPNKGKVANSSDIRLQPTSDKNINSFQSPKTSRNVRKAIESGEFASSRERDLVSSALQGSFPEQYFEDSDLGKYVERDLSGNINYQSTLAKLKEASKFGNVQLATENDDPSKTTRQDYIKIKGFEDDLKVVTRKVSQIEEDEVVNFQDISVDNLAISDQLRQYSNSLIENPSQFNLEDFTVEHAMILDPENNDKRNEKASKKVLKGSTGESTEEYRGFAAGTDRVIPNGQLGYIPGRGLVLKATDKNNTKSAYIRPRDFETTKSFLKTTLGVPESTMIHKEGTQLLALDASERYKEKYSNRTPNNALEFIKDNFNVVPVDLQKGVFAATTGDDAEAQMAMQTYKYLLSEGN